MKLAYIWYNPVERLTIERQVHLERPSWVLECIHECEAGDLESAIRLLKSGYDAILLHLSKPPCLALKLAEMAQLNRFPTRVIAFSTTDANPVAIKILFDGSIHPDRDIVMLVEKIATCVESQCVRNRNQEEIDSAIVGILNSDSVFQHQFRETFSVLYRAPFTVKDYQDFARERLKPASLTPGTRSSRLIFISYSAKIQDAAMFLRQALAKKGVLSFLAARDLQGGDDWEKEIRNAIHRCAEMIILLTPESAKRPWVMAEMGAAWVLGKRITPCLVHGAPDDMPELLTRRQACKLSTPEEIEQFTEQVASRIRHESEQEHRVETSASGNAKPSDSGRSFELEP